MNRHAKHRSGAVLIVMLVCLAVVSIISVGLVEQAASARKLARLRQRDAQALWLAESAVSRAAARLSLDADYAGETWSLAAGELGGLESGKVTIEIGVDDEQPSLREVRVVADVFRRLELRSRHSKQVVVAIPAVSPIEEQEP